MKCSDMSELEVYNNGTLDGFDFSTQCLHEDCGDECRCEPGMALDADGLCKAPDTCLCFYNGNAYESGPVDIGDSCKQW